jgi:hypothetical protein
MIRKKYSVFTILFIFLCVFKANFADGVQPELRGMTEDGSRKSLKSSRRNGPNIKLIQESCDLDEETLNQIKTGVNFLYDFYRIKLGYSFPKKFTVKLRVFGDFNEYKEYQNKVSRATQSNSGFYVNSLKEAVVFKNKNDKQFLSVLFHETSHMILRNRISDCPKWINEGLSEYFEGIDFTHGDEVLVKPQLIKDERTKRWLDAAEMPNVFYYVTIPNETWDREDDASPNPRTVGWSFVYFLMSSQKGQLALKDILNYISKHQGDPDASVRAMDYFYEGGHEQFKEDWKNWISGERYVQVIDTDPLVEPRFKRFLKSITMWVG